MRDFIHALILATALGIVAWSVGHAVAHNQKPNIEWWGP